MGLLSGLLALFGCNSNPTDKKVSQDNATIETSQPAENSTALKVGGLYAIKEKDGSYYICKILVLDDFAVHLRTYGNKFAKKPTQANSDTLQIIIGHAPIDKNGFLIDNPELLKVEKTKDSELEGYKIYLEAMGK